MLSFDSPGWFDVDSVVHDFVKSLFASQVALYCLHRRVPSTDERLAPRFEFGLEAPSRVPIPEPKGQRAKDQESVQTRYA
jgi:hypothetical protein